jgi:membrane-associated phospholipid phosphatase
MPTLDFDFDFDFNTGMSSPVVAGRRLRPRFNSDVASRRATLAPASDLVPPIAGGVAPNYPPFHEYWDADLLAYMHLDHFLAKLTAAAAAKTAQDAVAAGAANAAAVAAAVQNAANSVNAADLAWRPAYEAVARQLNTNRPPHEMNRNQLGGEVLRILELGLEREARFAEILDQDDGAGAINYWLGMLKIDPARHPATYLMVHVGRRIGEHISMYLKGYFRSPRPSQLCPAITPMIDPPVTPSYPAGHAVQSYLISYLLAYSLSDAAGLTNLPQHALPDPTSPLATFLVNQPPRGPLFDLADRVSENRIVAGIHYPTDIRAGRAVATQIFKDIQNVNSIWVNLRNAVRGEFPQYAR